jgi:hypothetical protein
MSGTIEIFNPLASVVFLCVPAMKGKPVAEQALLRGALERALGRACDGLLETERLVLDTPNGMLLVVLGKPHAALQAAQRALAAGSERIFGVSINHGPVTATFGTARDARLAGDGIDAVLSFGIQTGPGALVISRAFFEALAKSAPDAAATFFAIAPFTDEQVRSYELLAQNAAEQRAAARRLWLITGLACTAIIAGGVAARSVVQSMEAARQPAQLEFDIKPQGEVFVDGAHKGKSPPLSQLQVAPGSHRIEVRNGKFPPLVSEVELAPGEQMQIKHTFTAPKQPKPRTLIDRLKFWQ